MASLVNNGQSAKSVRNLTQIKIRCKTYFFSKIEQVGSERALECAHMFECVQRIRHDSIFSNNEEVDDIKTGDLQYLLAHAYLGKLYGEKVRLDIICRRASRSIQANPALGTTLHDILNQLLDYNMLEKNDKNFSSNMRLIAAKNL